MRIVHYLSAMRLADGGVVHAVADIAAAVARAGCEVRLLTRDAADVPELIPDPPASLDVRTLGPGRPGPLAAFDAARFAEHLDDADALHLHTPWDPANVAAARAARAAGVPYALSTHGMLDRWAMSIRPRKKRLYLKLAGERLLRGSAAVLCTSEEEAQQCRAELPGARVEALPLFCNMSFVGEPPGELSEAEWSEHLPGVPRDEPIVGFLGRVFMGKGLRVLIPAVGELRRSGVGCRLMVAGPMAEAFGGELGELARREGVSDRVHLLGRVSGARKSAALRAMRVMVLASIHENFGLVAPEALAAGTPVVVTRGVAIWRELERTGGAVVAEREPAALASAIRPLLEDGASAAEMGRAGRAGCAAWLDPSRNAERYASFYGSLAG